MEDLESPDKLIAKTLQHLNRFGTVDGDHHKQWVIDQVVRILTGPGYDQWIADREHEGYGWDPGTPP